MKLAAMKPTAAALALCLIAGDAAAQAGELETELRKLDAQEARAVLEGDFASIERLWSEDFTVNNPFNRVVKASAGPVRTGALRYSSFVREPESVQLHGDVVIIMGRETVVPAEGSPDAGQNLERRYTNIWMKKQGEWRLMARHASVVCPTGKD